MRRVCFSQTGEHDVVDTVVVLKDRDGCVGSATIVCLARGVFQLSCVSDAPSQGAWRLRVLRESLCFSVPTMSVSPAYGH